MMNRIFSIVKRDLKSSFRDALIVYIIIAPLGLAFLLRMFLPNLDNASVQFAVLEEEGELAAYLEEFGRVETFLNTDDLEDRILEADDVIGVVKAQDYEVILEGNETSGIFELAENVVLGFQGYEESPVDVVVSDVGWNVSLIGSVSAISMIMLASLLGGMLSGMNIVEERQLRTMLAMKVSPAGTMEFLLGKSIPGLVIPIIQSVLMLLIMGLTDINWLMTIIICIFSSMISLIIGILLGVTNEDPISAAAGLKVMMLPMSATILGTLLLPENLRFLLYWIPYYWTYQGVMDILMKTATWGNILLYCGALVGLTAIVFLMLNKKIKAGLTA